ncbi:MAG: hypothetical protein R3C05_08360 [Pirellulaceae bacterium]
MQVETFDAFRRQSDSVTAAMGLAPFKVLMIDAQAQSVAFRHGPRSSLVLRKSQRASFPNQN